MVTSVWKIMWREIRFDKLALTGLVLFAVAVAVVFIWAVTIDQDAATMVRLGSINQPPSAQYLLGTDPGGRDMLPMLILSARNSLIVTFIVTLSGAGIGILFGLFAGFYGGHVDNILMRLLDFFEMIPPIMLIIVLVSLIPNYTAVHFALILVLIWSWQGTARLIRAKGLQQGTLDYVSASKTLGTPNIVIIFREVAPNLVSIIVSNFTINLAANMGIETGLTFLGFGLPFATPSLGALVFHAATPAHLTGRLWLWLPAALFIIIMMLCVNFVGQALNRAADAKKRTV